MVTKEIAKLLTVEDRTVRNWIKKLAENNSVIAEKISVSSPAKPADWTLEETCQIIETGLGKNAADIFRMNAKEKTTVAPKPFLDAHEARLAAKAGLITPEEYRLIVGLDYPKPGELEPKIARQVYAVAQKAIRSEIEKAKTESKTNYLEFK